MHWVEAYEPLDGPTIRMIVHSGKSNGYRFADIVLGIVKSPAFQKRSSQYKGFFLECFITKRTIQRRTLLRGLGVSLALPLLVAMIPSMTALANTPANPARLRRLGFVYMPMGGDLTRWTPPGDTLQELSPTLQPLENIKNRSPSFRS